MQFLVRRGFWASLVSLPLCVLMLSTPLHAQSNEIELSGLVLDRTITRFGKDFFFYYTGYWRDMPNTEGITVVIHEQVFPQAGTRLWVEMQNETIFQTYFGRRHQDVKSVAEQAILISVDKVAQIQAEALLDSTLQQRQKVQ